jgi:hypothetical protein
MYKGYKPVGREVPCVSPMCRALANILEKFSKKGQCYFHYWNSVATFPACSQIAVVLLAKGFSAASCRDAIQGCKSLVVIVWKDGRQQGGF